MSAGKLQKVRHGFRATRRHNEDRVLAVVRGRLRVELQQGDAVAEASLRASDALAIPARTPYTVEAVQDAEIFLYTERTPHPALWGV